MMFTSLKNGRCRREKEASNWPHSVLGRAAVSRPAVLVAVFLLLEKNERTKWSAQRIVMPASEKPDANLSSSSE